MERLSTTPHKRRIFLAVWAIAQLAILALFCYSSHMNTHKFSPIYILACKVKENKSMVEKETDSMHNRPSMGPPHKPSIQVDNSSHNSFLNLPIQFSSEETLNCATSQSWAICMNVSVVVLIMSSLLHPLHLSHSTEESTWVTPYRRENLSHTKLQMRDNVRQIQEQHLAIIVDEVELQ